MPIREVLIARPIRDDARCVPASDSLSHAGFLCESGGESGSCLLQCRRIRMRWLRVSGAQRWRLRDRIALFAISNWYAESNRPEEKKRQVRG